MESKEFSFLVAISFSVAIALVSGTASADTLLLKSGDQLSGRWVSGDLALRASYGEINLPRGRVGSLTAAGSQHLLKVTTGTGQGFTGFLGGGPISFVMALGPELEVEASRIASLTVDETYALSTNGYFVIMQNGDVLTGDIEPRQVVMKTRDGEKTLAFDMINFIGFAGRERGGTRVLLRDDSSVEGRVMTSSYTMILDGGGDELQLPVDDIDIIACVPGFRPAPGPAADPVSSAISTPSPTNRLPRVVNVTSTTHVNAGLPLVLTNGMAIVESIPGDSPFNGVILAGDILHTIDGSPYRPTALTRKVYAMLNGERALVRLGIVRDNDSFTVDVRPPAYPLPPDLTQE